MRIDWVRVLMIFALVGMCSAVGVWYWLGSDDSFTFLTPEGKGGVPTATPLPLLNYSFKALIDKEWKRGKIEIGDLIEETDALEDVDRYMFHYDSEGRKVSGMMNVPEGLDPLKTAKTYPVIVMLRGYVDEEIYKTGVGTAPAAEAFAGDGYVTLAPDFLGFGDSDEAYEDVWHERFSKPVQVLNLLASIGSLKFIDTTRIGFWAHSNGGQVALSVLEITGATVPTTLWAPVTKPFPYSILYFTDEFDDEGRDLRKELARLEQDYDVRDYSITNFFDRIKASLLLHQGTIDDAVPVEWSREFVDKLKKVNKDIDIEYFEYVGADHDLNGSWDRVVARDLEFFGERLQ